MGGQNEFGVNKGVDNDNFQKADEEEEEKGKRDGGGGVVGVVKADTRSFQFKVSPQRKLGT